MKLLIIDADGIHLAFAWRCALAGHEVKWFIRERGQPNLAGRGFKGVERVENWVSHVGWADLVVPMGNNLYLERLDFFRQKGVKVFGPSKESASLEIERGKGMKFLEAHGITVPPYKVFATLKDAERHVWREEKRFVFKTLGDAEDKSLSYCAKSPAAMIAQLRKWQEIGLDPKGEVMLQEFVEGVEFAVSCWMGRDGWVSPPNENFEHKKLMSGEYGPNTGETGTVMAYTTDSKLFKETLAKIEKPLREMSHTGDVDLNFIVSKEGKPFALEFTCRPGYPANSIMMMAHKGDPVEWMAAALEGKKTLEVSEEVTVGVVVAIPPFPQDGMERAKKEGLPIYGATRKVQRYFQPTDVQIMRLPDMEGKRIVERPMWATSGEIVGVMTGTGKTIKQACKRAYDSVGEISVSNMMVRDDVGERLETQLKELQKHGYATCFRYA